MTDPLDSVDASKYRPHGPWVVTPDDVVHSYYDRRGNVEVVIQDQFTPPIDGLLGKSLGFTTVAVETAIDDITVELTSAAAASIGDRIVLVETDPDPEPGKFYIGIILGIAVNVVTLDTPINFAYIIGTIALIRNSDLAVDGSVTTQLFDFPRGPGVISIDIVRFIIVMECTGAPDDSKFGDLAALTNGVVLRKNGLDGIQNFWNFKSNGDIAAFSYDVTYSDKAGAGNHGVRSRLSYGGQDKHGVVIRLAPNEALEFLVQDDLSGLVKFTVTVQGHVVED